MKQIRERPL